MSSNQVGSGGLPSLLAGSTVCHSDGSQVSHLVGQTKGKECSIGKMEPNPSAVCLHCGTPSWDIKQEC